MKNFKTYGEAREYVSQFLNLDKPDYPTMFELANAFKKAVESGKG